jgi:hypothetical protein
MPVKNLADENLADENLHRLPGKSFGACARGG